MPNAARSGLDQYDADAGFKDAGIDLALGFGQGPGWRASLIGRYRRLLNDAADSPIVKDEGDGIILRGRCRRLSVLTMRASGGSHRVVGH